MASSHNYINPAFCQQSEFYLPQQRCVNPSVQQNHLKSNSNQRLRTDISDNPIHNIRDKRSGGYSREPTAVEVPPKLGPKPRYGPVPVPGFKPGPRVIRNKAEGLRYGPVFDDKEETLRQGRSQHRYEELPDPNEYSVDDDRGPRYAELPAMNESILRVHRYASIPTIERDLVAHTAQYESLPVEGYPDQELTRGSRYCSVPNSPTSHQVQNQRALSPTTPRKNSLATQKLHELLTTPQKQMKISHTSRKSPIRTISPTTERTSVYTYPNKMRTPKELSPKDCKAQQRLDYNVNLPQTCAAMIENYEYEMSQLTPGHRTAIISPRLAASPSLYSETISGSLNKSSNNLSYNNNSCMTVAAVCLMMVICGVLNSGLCLYMISNTGRSYYLDLGLISGFACVALGSLGFRSRRCKWSPNRNFISGYILLTVFTLLNCCGLLILLALHPPAGSALSDVTSGAVSGLSALTLILASLGVITTYWCKVPPPDNRVASVDQAYQL